MLVTRILANLLVLVAVLMMPFGMAGAAAAPSQRDAAAHHGATAAMAMEHCPDTDGNADSGVPQCAMACSAALPASPPTPQATAVRARSPNLPAAAGALAGILTEIATPPPKRS